MRSGFGITAMGVVLATALAVPATAQEEGGKDWGYNKGFYFRQGNFELKLSTRTQFRFTQTMFDAASIDEDRGEFTLPRTRLSLDGHAYHPWLKYKIQYDFTGDDDSGGTEKRPDLRDLYVDFTKNGAASVRLGQFKAPFGIQELTSSGNQEFVDRSIASVEFAPSRQQGAMLYGATREKTFGYAVGLFNGNGRNKATNDNDTYLMAARINFDPNGEYKLSETAVDHPDKVNYTIGAAWQTNAEDAAGDLDETSVEGFFGLKYKRLFVLADTYTRTLEDPLGDVDSDGTIAQVGYFFVPKKFEVSVRWSEFDPDADADDDSLTETRIGFGWYFSKHELKFQADYGTIEDDSDPTADLDVFRAQLQIVF